MYRSVTLVFLLLFSVFLAGGQSKVPVFVSGEDGHQVYRIPAIIRLGNGDLLAFAEGRVQGAGDFGDINLVMKRSTDKGKSWGALITLVDNDTLQAGNPAPVVDMIDPRYPNGRIFLFYNTGNNHEGEVRKGKGLREVWYIASTDDGATWSSPVNITPYVHRPRQPQVKAEYNFAEDWRSYANTPGHALQISDGEHRGRIYIPANHSAGDPQEHFTDYAAHGYYTDDHGKTFHLSESIPVKGSNESTATSLADGTLLMNMRNQRGDVRARIIALSRDGGATWDTTYFDNNLPDPVCEGAIITIGTKQGQNIIAFCNPADVTHRDNLTLRISYDGGRTWSKKIVVDKAPPGKERDHAAYSDIVPLNNKEIGVLYESQQYSRIIFTAVHWR